MEIPYTVAERPDTGLNNGKIGIWLFLASEVMLFGALFVLMLAFFGKPFALGSVAALAPVATLMVIVLAAWLVVDTLVASRQRSMAAR